jgi:hypothetical protein
LGLRPSINPLPLSILISAFSKVTPFTTYNQVKVKIIGKVVDINYARKLAQSKSELTLQEIILLDIDKTDGIIIIFSKYFSIIY